MIWLIYYLVPPFLLISGLLLIFSPTAPPSKLNRLKIVEITASPETLSKTQVRSGIGSVLAAAVREPGTLGLFCSQKSSADWRKNKESRKNQQIL